MHRNRHRALQLRANNYFKPIDFKHSTRFGVFSQVPTCHSFILTIFGLSGSRLRTFSLMTWKPLGVTLSKFTKNEFTNSPAIFLSEVMLATNKPVDRSYLLGI